MKVVGGLSFEKQTDRADIWYTTIDSMLLILASAQCLQDIYGLLVFPKLVVDRWERNPFRDVAGQKSSPPLLRIASDLNSSNTTSGTFGVDGKES